MNQVKIGNFIKELRKEQKLTQEELAEKFNVARRTVSRWETGSNMPDLDILIEMADFYNVDLREILDGERKSEKMNEELKETVLKVAEYSDEEKKKMSKVVLTYFVLGIIAMLIHLVMTFMELPETFWVGFAEGGTISMAIAAMLLGILHMTGILYKKKHLRNKIGEKYDKSPHGLSRQHLPLIHSKTTPSKQIK